MVRKCKSGHWYDPGLFDECPHCKKDSEKLKLSLNDDEDEDDRTVSMMDLDLSLDAQLGSMGAGETGPGGGLGSDAGSGSATGPGLGLSPLDFGIIPSGSADEDEDKTISFWDFGSSRLPAVTGWLVGLTGEDEGKDFRLHTGKNFIGRGINMDVVLSEDKQVSREKHCSVTYDPKGNKFFLSGEQGNTVYRNGSPVEGIVEITDGDIITAGETELAFVPYCKEERTWERAGKKE